MVSTLNERFNKYSVLKRNKIIIIKKPAYTLNISCIEMALRAEMWLRKY